MATSQQLEDFVKTSRGKGQTDEQIRAVLINAGWPEEDINSALNPVVAPSTSTEETPLTATSGVQPVGTPAFQSQPYNNLAAEKGGKVGYLFLGSTILTLISIFLPLINLGGLFSVSYWDGDGKILFFLLLPVIGGFFWKKNYAIKAGIVLSSIVFVWGIYQVVQRPSSSGGDFLGNISVFDVLGIGFYIGMLSLIGNVVFGVLALRKG